MVEGGAAIVKYLLFLSNLLLWAAGLSLIIAGAVLQLKYAGLLDILGDDRLATPVLLLATGALCTLLGFLGCCGAIRENYCLVVSFAVLLSLLLLVETAAAIVAYALHAPLQESIATQLSTGMTRYNSRMAWDETQRNLECCGVTNSSDWARDFSQMPDSCCVVSGCLRSATPSFHAAGCMEKVEDWLALNAALVGSVSAVVTALQFVGVCFACCLSKSILKDFHDFYY